ncbi:MAG: HAD-IIB family hydrolase [Deltaproteobacteria bacterium]|nr:HAD-IIB family hydrolase [Deltaproteobacteria bacterium]
MSAAGREPAPLAELSDARLAGVEVLVTDVDDTLTREGKLEREAYDALWALREAGVATVLITGRPLGWAEVMARQWPVAMAIGENGAGSIWLDDVGVNRAYWDSELERADKQRALASLRQEVAEALPNAQVSDDDDARRCDLAWDVAEHARMAPETLAALERMILAAGMRFVVSSVHAHAIPGDWDKARGAQRAIRARLGIDPLGERGCFIGDSPNDAAAFAGFELSVGVANVRPHLPALRGGPGYITREDRGRGFAELAARLVDARRG